jgi:hypothetical protein
MTHHHFLTRFEMSGRNIKPLARTATKDRICQVFPLYSLNAEELLYEEPCCADSMPYNSFHGTTGLSSFMMLVIKEQDVTLMLRHTHYILLTILDTDMQAAEERPRLPTSLETTTITQTTLATILASIRTSVHI